MKDRALHSADLAYGRGGHIVDWSAERGVQKQQQRREECQHGVSKALVNTERRVLTWKDKICING